MRKFWKEYLFLAHRAKHPIGGQQARRLWNLQTRFHLSTGTYHDIERKSSALSTISTALQHDLYLVLIRKVTFAIILSAKPSWLMPPTFKICMTVHLRQALFTAEEESNHPPIYFTLWSLHRRIVWNCPSFAIKARKEDIARNLTGVVDLAALVQDKQYYSHMVRPYHSYLGNSKDIIIFYRSHRNDNLIPLTPGIKHGSIEQSFDIPSILGGEKQNQRRDNNFGFGLVSNVIISVTSHSIYLIALELKPAIVDAAIPIKVLKGKENGTPQIVFLLQFVEVVHPYMCRVYDSLPHAFFPHFFYGLSQPSYAVSQLNPPGSTASV